MHIMLLTALHMAHLNGCAANFASGNALGNALLAHHKLRCTAILQALQTALKMWFTRLLSSYTYTHCKRDDTNLVIAASNKAVLCHDPHSHLCS